MPNRIFIPSEFKLNNKKITVDFDNEYCDKEKLFGESDFTERTIVLCDKDKGNVLKKSDIDKTFYHELVHFLLDAMGKHKLKYDEDFVESLGLLIYEFERTKK